MCHYVFPYKLQQIKFYFLLKNRNAGSKWFLQNHTHVTDLAKLMY
jgi:hypothetical protein